MGVWSRGEGFAVTPKSGECRERDCSFGVLVVSFDTGKRLPEKGIILLERRDLMKAVFHLKCYSVFGDDDVVGVVGLDLEIRVQDVRQQFLLGFVVDAGEVGSDASAFGLPQMAFRAALLKDLLAAPQVGR